MRLQNEKSGSSSLFAQPMAIEHIPEQPPLGGLASQPGTDATSIEAPAKAARSVLEARMETVLSELMRPMDPPSAVARQGHLALLKRWYYRPEVRRVGEICFPDAEGHWPLKSMLRSVGRVAAKNLSPARLE
jgi:excinuclease ABC subunit C